MLDRIKAFADTMKGVLLYVLTPLLFLAGAIYYLMTKNTELKTDLEAKDGEEKLNELQGEETKVDESAASASDEYARLRDAYMRASHQSSGQSSSGQGSADPHSD